MLGNYKIYKGSGRARCYECRELIPKNSCQFQIFFSEKRWHCNWTRKENYHLSCILKQAEPFVDRIVMDWQSQFRI
jgi:hypothetical protein